LHYLNKITLNGKRSIPDITVKIDLVLATHFRRSSMLGEARIGEIVSTNRFTLCFSLPSQKKKGGGTPANADPYPPHLAMRLAPS